jgi:3-oxo-4-pregnene-20-carboxyl-CoA dehydrogenase alpha subunit
VAQAAAHVLDHARADQPGYDQALWKELGRAGLLAVALPGWLGGDGLSVLEVTALLTEVGRRAAPVPALATVMLGMLPVVRCGDRDLQQALLPGAAAGETVLTAALREPSDPLPARPATTAHLDGGPGTVSGVKIGVPYAAAASHVLVPASITTHSQEPAHSGPEATGIVIVDPAADGVTLDRTPASSDNAEYTSCISRSGTPSRRPAPT